MASKPTVTMTLAGDESKLSQAFDAVGASSEKMADKVKASSREVEQTGDAFDSLGEATDSSESKFQGFADTLTGTQDIMTGFREGDIVGMATGFADLAGGLTEFVVPALSSFAAFLGGPLRTAMSFIAAHPLLITLGLLTAAFITLWTTSETFRNIVIGVFQAVGGFIKSVFGGAIDWLIDRWNGVTGFFQRLADGIGRIFSGIGEAIKNAFKSAINFAIDILNGGISGINFLIRGYNSIPFAPDIPQIPKIPKLHTGGVVPGMPGTEVPIMAMAGEKVSTSSQGGGAAELRITGDGGKLHEVILYLLRVGDVQLIDSNGNRIMVA